MQRMKPLVRGLVKGFAPSLLATRQSSIAKRMSRERFWDRQNAFAQQHFPAKEISVMAGPFAGLRYINESVWGPIEPKWLGTYEEELRHIVEALPASNYSTVIDIGSAEGYYSVGLARMLPAARVLSYEIDANSRAQQQRLAELNGVGNLALGGRCDHAELNLAIRGRTLIVCDIEGAEIELLDPTKCLNLRRADILLELHETDRYSFEEAAHLFRERFDESHDIEQIASKPRMAFAVGGNGSWIAAEYLDESREPGQCWLWMRARP